MNTTKYFLLLILTLSLVACSKPAQEPAAAPTQPPPPTVTPEPTPTAIPYNLNVLVTDPNGIAIPGASAQIGDQTAQAGATGIVSFANLSAGPLEMTVSAQGYQARQLTQALQPGDNQVEVVLEPDPFGLLTDNACAPGETLLYVEDFQDGQAQGWDAIENQVPGWSVEEEAGQPGNRLAVARSQQGMSMAWYDRENTSLDNVIWRLRLKPLEKGHTQLNFRFVEKPGYNGRYFIGVGGGGANLVRYENNQGVDLGPLGEVRPGEWHLFEIGYFDGALTVFVDGEQRIAYQDPQPWQGGTISLEPHPESGGPGEGTFFYDDLSVCGLSAPPLPLPKPKTGYDLSLAVSNTAGQPLSLVSVTVTDADGKPIEALALDASARLSLSDLTTGTVNLAVSAPGYIAIEQGLIIEKGEPAELTLTLERDPLGLPPELACAPGETPLYIEDFQDGKAQGWRNITAALELNAQNGWSLTAEESGNTLLQAANSMAPANDYLENVSFTDAVWRVKVYSTGNDTDGFLSWRQSFEQGDLRYFVPFGGQQFLQLIRFTSGDGIPVAQSSIQLAAGKWHLFEISTYQSVTEVWLDGKKLFSYTDPQPLPPGTIGLEMHLREGVTTVFWFDDLAVCGLSAPFAPLPQAL